MGYRADKLVIDARMDTHTQTDAGNDNTWRPKLAWGKNCSYNKTQELCGVICLLKSN